MKLDPSSVPSVNELLAPVMDALKALGGSGYVPEIDDKVIEQLQISDEVAEIPHGEKRSETRLKNSLYGARTRLKAEGFLENPKRSLWTVAPGQHIDPQCLVETGSDDSPETKDEWRDELFTVLTETLHPDAFERLVQLLLRQCGFIEVHVTGKPGDDGIDGIGIAKMNDLMSFHVFFQCKRQKSAVAVGAMRDFRGAMANRPGKGMFITTSSFTREARKEATRDRLPHIDLIDGEQLMEKLKELRLGLKVETVEKVEIDKNWYQNI